MFSRFGMGPNVGTRSQNVENRVIRGVEKRCAFEVLTWSIAVNIAPVKKTPCVDHFTVFTFFLFVSRFAHHVSLDRSPRVAG